MYLLRGFYELFSIVECTFSLQKRLPVVYHDIKFITPEYNIIIPVSSFICVGLIIQCNIFPYLIRGTCLRCYGMLYNFPEECMGWEIQIKKFNCFLVIFIYFS